ncbi:stress response protein AzuC [Candidatus Symbiopectobacterium sp. NZEC151]|uniref:Stress response protein AzuC n=1 Tax=Symbiopectobacterium purcellii TaxID=2871826 RepID=A0ABX9ATS4_9ENTR|nr:stress response protein AzuC [Candidatus Symbiopectobacterium sp. NZEC151]MCW2480892.1 stress response protein AzuC [Candidatus Symbiopectobacterium sp. NZEC135]MCW2486793.1 stress response protein AzuC [Candidatus Symbiopectobacterium sp. NZEC127]QZN98171.1 stress response protein AzuC [Symbiopectobacterium purcellii]
MVRKLLKRILAAYVLAHKDVPPGAMY